MYVDVSVVELFEIFTLLLM